MWLFQALMASLLWGLDYALAERIFGHRVSPLTLLALQMLAGTLVLFPIAWARGLGAEVREVYGQGPVALLLLATLSSFVAGNLFIAFSIKAQNATWAGLIETSYPLFIALFSWILFRQSHLSPSVVIGGLLICAGTVVIYVFS